jgi:Flp pilus assembly protein TadD
MLQRTVEHLLADVNFALERGMTAHDLVPMLEHLLRCAPVASEIHRFARLELGRQLLESDPFRTATLARSVAHERGDNDEAFGLLGLALTLLGHFRAAASAHRRALRIAPSHPGHAHNLGHLLDAALGCPSRAIPWLERAFRGAPDVPGIASSYAHALVGVGRIDDARTMLRKYARLDAKSADTMVSKWLLLPTTARETA